MTGVLIQKNDPEMRIRQDASKAETLARLASRLNAMLKPEAVIQVLCEEVSRSLGVPSASLTLLNKEKMVYSLAGSVGLPDEINHRIRPLPEKALPKWLSASEGLVVSLDLDAIVDFPDADVFASYQINRMAIAKMIHDDELIGFLCAMLTDRQRQFNEDELGLIKGMADQAALALSYAWHLEEVDRRALEFSILYQISVELAEQHELPAIYRLMVDRSMNLLRASSGAIFLYDLRQKDLEVVWSRGKAVQPSLRIHMGEGIVGSAAMTGQMMVVNDYAAQEKKLSRAPQIPAFAMIAAPMLYSGDMIGILAVFEEVDPLHGFHETDGRLLMLVAGQLASAVHNTRLYEETSERAAQLTLLYDAGLALNSVLEPRAQLEFLLKIAMEALHADRAEFYGYIDGQEEFRFELGLGYSEKVLDEFQRTKIAASDDYCLVGWVGKNRLPINVLDAFKDPRYVVVDPEVRSMMLASVEHEGHLLGVLAMSGVRVNSFNPQAERSLNLYANVVAVAIENARLFNEVQTSLKRSQSQRSIDYAITANYDLYRALNMMLDQFLNQLGVDAADILLINADSQTLDYAVGRGFIKAAIQMAKIKIGEGLAGKAAYDRRILMAPDLEQYPDWHAHAPFLASEGFHSYYALPFSSQGFVKGVLEVYSRKLLTPDREWLVFLGSLERQITVALENSNMVEGLRATNAGLVDAFDRTLEGWLRGLTLHTSEPQDHNRRLVEKTLRMAKASGASNERLIHVYRGALLHDVGMLGVPTAILNQPGPLNEEEWGIIRNHPVFAYELIYPIAILRPAMEIPYGHHEKWDGSGYPRGLAGALIPEAARWFSVVDVFESLTTPRVYRPEPWPEEKARQYLIDQSGKAFEPKAVETFLNLIMG